jgi:hypothetical protein
MPVLSMNLVVLDNIMKVKEVICRDVGHMQCLNASDIN